MLGEKIKEYEFPKIEIKPLLTDTLMEITTRTLDNPDKMEKLARMMKAAMATAPVFDDDDRMLRKIFPYI